MVLLRSPCLGEAILIRPLTRTTAGTPYYRPEAVEAEIMALLSLDIDERMARLCPTAPSHATPVSPEALVYFMREERRANHESRFNRLYTAVMKHYLSFFRSPDRQGEGVIRTDGALEDLRRHAVDRFVEKIRKDRAEGDDRLDIYEIRFGLAAAKDRSSARKAVYRLVDREEALNPLEDGREASAEVEAAAARLSELSGATKNDVSDDLKRVLVAIDTLPEKYRRVATMTLNSIPIEAKDANTPSISGLLGCTPKTARARRDRAVELIQLALGLGDLT